MNDDPDLFAFPELPDDAVIAVNAFIEALYTRFQNHYFAQIHRYCRVGGGAPGLTSVRRTNGPYGFPVGRFHRDVSPKAQRRN